MRPWLSGSASNGSARLTRSSLRTSVLIPTAPMTSLVLPPSLLPFATASELQELEVLLSRATPAGLAATASRGRWRTAPHLDLLNDRLVAVAEGRCPRLLITMPPRHGKSYLTSHHFPAWFLGVYPDRRVILTSYEADFAAGWGRKARDVLEVVGPDLFGVAVRHDSKAADRWDIEGHTGGMTTAGVGGPITGKGADLLIIDDPVKNAEEAASPTYRQRAWDWYTSTAYTRLEPGGAVVLIQCMVGSTPVLMADGTEKPLCDVRAGDAIATYEAGRISTSVVRNWANQGPDCVFTIRMKSGTIVTANKRHPFLVQCGEATEWVRLKNLKVGDRILRASIGANGEALPVPSMGATSLPGARATATLITTSSDGRTVSVRRPSIRNPDALPICGTGTELASKSTARSSRNRTGGVPYAGNRPGLMSVPTGAGNSVSTTITRPARCEDCSATTVISWSGTGRRRTSSSRPLSTYGIIPDEVVEIVSAGREDVFDIQVEGTENFIANGLVSHNTRWHEDDLAGRVIANAAESGESWDVLNLPALAEGSDPLGRRPGQALWPERFDEVDLARIRATLGSYYFTSLYQQRPAPAEGDIFRRSWFSVVDAHPATADRVRYWDKAGTEGGGAHTAGVLMSRVDDLYHIEDVVRGQWSALEREMVIRQTAEADGKSVAVWVEQEPGSGGKESAEATVRNLAGFIVHAERVTGDKVTRARPFAAQAEAGNVRLVRGGWNAAFLDEAITFPNGKFKDQIDAASGAFNKLAVPRPDYRLYSLT
jgi:predicted phage terminase large subunit-like protein